MAGSHGLRQKGNLVYDENFHVPLVVVHPDVPGGGRSHALGSAVDLAPTVLELAGVDPTRLKSEFSGLHGRSLAPVLFDPATRVREGVLTAVESVLTLDADFWRAFGRGDAPARVKSGELRPDWRKRGFLRGWTDERYTFGRYFSPLEPNRPRTVDELVRDNDVVLYDRDSDPGETQNLASDPAHLGLVESLLIKLEAPSTPRSVRTSVPGCRSAPSCWDHRAGVATPSERPRPAGFSLRVCCREARPSLGRKRLMVRRRARQGPDVLPPPPSPGGRGGPSSARAPCHAES